MKLKPKVRHGFVRVLVTERNKTIQIREKHARNQNYMNKHGLVLVPDPVAPPVAAHTPDVEVKQVTAPKTKANGR